MFHLRGFGDILRRHGSGTGIDTPTLIRKIQVDLTLNRNVEAKVLQLKIYDAADELNPLIKENVTNNTLIENDFDFE